MRPLVLLLWMAMTCSILDGLLSAYIDRTYIRVEMRSQTEKGSNRIS